MNKMQHPLVNEISRWQYGKNLRNDLNACISETNSLHQSIVGGSFRKASARQRHARAHVRSMLLQSICYCSSRFGKKRRRLQKENQRSTLIEEARKKDWREEPPKSMPTKNIVSHRNFRRESECGSDENILTAFLTRGSSGTIHRGLHSDGSSGAVHRDSQAFSRYWTKHIQTHPNTLAVSPSAARSKLSKMRGGKWARLPPEVFP